MGLKMDDPRESATRVENLTIRRQEKVAIIESIWGGIVDGLRTSERYTRTDPKAVV